MSAPHLKTIRSTRTGLFAALAVAALAAAGSLVGVPAPAVAAAPTTYAQSYKAACPSGVQATPALNRNLISNPGAESVDTSQTPPNATSWVAYPDCWTLDSTSATGTMESASYSGSGYYGTPPTAQGSRFFFGGIDTDTEYSYTYGFQTIDLSSVNVAGQPFSLTALVGGYSTDADYATVIVSFEDAAGDVLYQGQAGAVTEGMRAGKSVFIPQGTAGVVPSGTTQAVVEIVAYMDHSGYYDYGTADNLNLTVGSSADSLMPYTSSTACPAADQVAPAYNENLIENPGAEATTAFNYSGTATNEYSAALPDCWTTASEENPTTQTVNGGMAGTFEAIPYSKYAGLTVATQDPSPGNNMFYGGEDLAPNDAAGVGIATTGSQLIDVSAMAPGAQNYQLSGYLGGYSTQTDNASVTATFEDAAGNTVGVATIGPVTEAQRGGSTSMLYQAATGVVPADTAQILVTVTTTMITAGYNNDAMADDLDLYIGSNLPPPPPPSSTSTLAYTSPSGTDGSLYNPTGVAAANGTVYVSNTKHNVVLALHGGTTTVIAGSFEGYGEAGDGGPATAATLFQPAGLALDAAGDLFIADGGDNVVREVLADGTIRRVAGDGTAGSAGDGGLAVNAELDDPQAVAVNAAGDLFIADSDSNEVREVTPDGNIRTFAGTGTAGYTGDGAPAASAELGQPSGLAIDSLGNLYIADSADNVVRRVDAITGLITTVAGDYAADQTNDGVGSDTGDGGPATSATLHDPEGLSLDPAGDLFIADRFNSVIRKVTPLGTITTVLNGLSGPAAVSVDPSTDNLDVADTDNNRVLVSTGHTASTPIGPGPIGLQIAPPALAESSVPVLPVIVGTAGGAVVLIIVGRRRRRRATA